MLTPAKLVIGQWTQCSTQLTMDLIIRHELRDYALLANETPYLRKLPPGCNKYAAVVFENEGPQFIYVLTNVSSLLFYTQI